MVLWAGQSPCRLFFPTNWPGKVLLIATHSMEWRWCSDDLQSSNSKGILALKMKMKLKVSPQAQWSVSSFPSYNLTKFMGLALRPAWQRIDKCLSHTNKQTEKQANKHTSYHNPRAGGGEFAYECSTLLLPKADCCFAFAFLLIEHRAASLANFWPRLASFNLFYFNFPF